jgi:hypothetical protein
MNARSQNCQNSQNPTWLEERKQLEEVFGHRIYSDSKSGVTLTFGKRSYVQLINTSDGVGADIVEDSPQGARMQALPTYGLIPLLAIRSKKFAKLWREVPESLKARYQVSGLPFESRITDRDFIDAALWPEESLERSKALLGHCMALAPDWTLPCLSEIRGTYAKRLDFMPELIMMSFKHSEMLQHAELDAKIGKFYPDKWKSLKVQERRKDLRKRLQKLVGGNSKK